MSDVQAKTKSFADYVKSLGYLAAAAGGIFLFGVFVGPKVLALYGAPESLESLTDRIEKIENSSIQRENLGVFERDFSDFTNGVKELTRNAIFCALSRVDDNSNAANCQVIHDDGIWKIKSGSSSKENGCWAICITETQP